jgi:hypothetical protein
MVCSSILLVSFLGIDSLVVRTEIIRLSHCIRSWQTQPVREKQCILLSKFHRCLAKVETIAMFSHAGFRSLNRFAYSLLYSKERNETPPRPNQTSRISHGVTSDCVRKDVLVSVVPCSAGKRGVFGVSGGGGEAFPIVVMLRETV